MHFDVFQSGGKIKIVSFQGLSKRETIDVTEDVFKSIKGSGHSDDPNYDKYEDLEYVEKRLNLTPGKRLFSMQFMYLLGYSFCSSGVHIRLSHHGSFWIKGMGIGGFGYFNWLSY